MIKRILLITLLLVPLHSTAHEWNFTTWRNKSLANDLSLAVCYKLLMVDEYDLFMNHCDIHTSALEYMDIMEEFNLQRDTYHTDMTEVDFLAEHFSGAELPNMQRNFRLQHKVRATIMTLYLAENMLHNNY